MPNSSGSDRSVSVSCSVVPDSLRPHELTAAHQAPLSMGFSRQGFWSGLPFPSPGDLPHSEIKPRSALQAGSLPTELPGKSLDMKLYIKIRMPNLQYLANSFHNMSSHFTSEGTITQRG